MEHAQRIEDERHSVDDRLFTRNGNSLLGSG